jgi:epoxide hydrolase 4
MIQLEYEQQLIRTNGVSLNVIQAGDPAGELTILLHGFPEFWYGWRHQLPALAAQGLRLWVPDQRGYNLSDKPDGVRNYRVDELVADVVGLIHAAGEEKANIIGHDWGAMVAWWLALRHPEKVAKLGIFNVPHPHVLERTLRSSPSQMLKSWYAGMFQMPFLPEKLVGLNNWRIMAGAMQSSGKRGSFTDADMQQYREAWSRPGTMTTMMNWYRAYVRHRPADPPAWRLHMPTLMIWGTKDRFLSEDMARPSVEYCEDGELYLLTDATHWVQHDNATRVNELLSEFLI